MKKAAEKIGVVIVAGGNGSRLKNDIPKQYLEIGGKAVIAHSTLNFLNNNKVDYVQCVIGKGQEKLYLQALKSIKSKKLLPPVIGGKTRQDSVLNGLKALKNKAIRKVLIHDAARPFTSQNLIEDLLQALNKNKAVIPAIEIADTLKEITGTKIKGTVDKYSLKAVQTPQCFYFDDILNAHQKIKGEALTDDAAVAEKCGIKVNIIKGEENNFKITSVNDLMRAKKMLEKSREYRSGTGFDVHAFVKKPGGNSVAICGIKIPHEKSLLGHSDADVGLHALVDSILGAAGLGDIGQHFPPSDKKWKNADSAIFVEHAVKLLREKNAGIANVDITIICEAPKIGPHREKMRKKVAELLEIDLDRVNIKATTTEQLGFTGRKEGIAAQSIATIFLET